MKKIFFILPLLFLLVSCKKEVKTVAANAPAKAPSQPGPGATKYSIIYNGNGNTGGTAPVDAKTYDSGSPAIIFGNDGALVKAGYFFVGWSLDPTGTGTTYMPGATVTVGNSNMTFYARWLISSSNVYKITY